MKRTLKRAVHRLLTGTWLRQGTIRTVPVGPYRGLRYHLSEPMMSRLDVFYRAYECDVSGWLIDHIRPGMTVYVLGGHVGIHVLHIGLLLRGRGHIFAFEGWPENATALQRNVDLNPQTGIEIKVVPQCIAAEPGTVHMVAGSSDGKHHIAGTAESFTTDVPATTLNTFWQSSQDCPNVILMDIEGSEGAALEGGELLLAACKPRLVLEHHGKDAALIDWLTARGYRVEPLGRRHLVAES